ncbi:MAG: metal-dependent transcriptional regulator [Methanomicrobiales archaeon]|nr:metal-dependent transcriptional regulator [Methanomicrobiales archaeon]
MRTALHEDILEAILNWKGERAAAPVVTDIAAVLRLEPASIETELLRLVDEGLISRAADGGIQLLPKGTALAERIVRRHRVLECFLEEKLGIDGAAASQSACVLEHTVTDDRIEQLSCALTADSTAITPLSELPEGALFEVKVVRGIERYGRLSDLGILPGERILLRRKLHNGGVVVRVKRCDIALSKEIATLIFGEKCG